MAIACPHTKRTLRGLWPPRADRRLSTELVVECLRVPGTDRRVLVELVLEGARAPRVDHRLRFVLAVMGPHAHVTDQRLHIKLPVKVLTLVHRSARVYMQPVSVTASRTIARFKGGVQYAPASTPAMRKGMLQSHCATFRLR